MKSKKIKNITECIKIINSPKVNKVFILSGYNSLIKSGLKDSLMDEINDKNKIKMYFKKENLPDTKELIKIIKEFKIYKPDLFIAIGGGAVLDYAKIVNIIQDSKNLIFKIKNYNYKSKKKNSKLIAIPTTAGSGAEVTSNAVIYHKKIKYSFEDKLLVPDNFCLCPNALINIPRKIKASSGFDAIAQSIESILSNKSNNKSIQFAKDSLKISNNYFMKYLKVPNFHNSLKMAEAANLSGQAINISKTTAPHATSYGFSAMHNVSHGHAVSLNFEGFMRFNYLYSENKLEIKNKFKEIFKNKKH